MKRSVIPIRGSAEEHAKWKEAAGSETFSAWARRVLNEHADDQNAREAETDQLKADRLKELAVSFPGSSTEALPEPVYTQPKMQGAPRGRSEPFCVHRRRRDEFCPRCDA